MVVEHESFGKVTEETCHEIIGKKLKTPFKIVRHQQVFPSVKNGFLGEHSTLTIEVEQKESTKSYDFFVKTIPHVESQRQFVLEIKGFFKESQFFGKYLDKLREKSLSKVLETAIPVCFKATEEMVIFEDLVSRGFETYDSRKSLTFKQAKAALAAFARLHASGLLLEELMEQPLSTWFAEEMEETFYSNKENSLNALNSCKHGMRALIDYSTETKDISKDTLRELAVEGITNQKIHVKPTQRFRNTVCHADTWTKNLMLRESLSQKDEFEGVLVDFQTYRYGPPAQDVMGFLHLATDRALRDDFGGELLEFYFGELSGVLGEGVISREEFFEACGVFKQFALTQTVTHGMVVFLSEEFAWELFSDAEKCKFVNFENKYDFVLEMCQRDEGFRGRIMGCVDDLRELYVEKKQKNGAKICV